MSRIWDALKEAEQERARGTLRRFAGQPKKLAGKGGPDRRKAQRSSLEVPLLVYGSDADKQPFHEETDTVDITAHGCLLVLEADVVRGQRLFLTNMQNQAERECRVIHVGKRARGKARIGVEFLHAAPDFWRDPKRPRVSAR
jgi:hypothetical protein